MIYLSSHEYHHILPTISDEGHFEVWSNELQRWFSGSTLTIARTQRSEAERVYCEHHMKNEDTQ